ncbi:hypothetical protein ACIQVU_19395 [Lysinibacillus sp. NPDC098008]|uniref:hypothetical protein n=1 Tax=Lysinibacillus sp. NPDC098008 TaxID=3364146 RepID=UPI00380483EE
MEYVSKKRGRGRPKNIKSMNLVEVLEVMKKDFASWKAEADPWDFEALVLYDDMDSCNELKKLFRATGLDDVPSTKYLLDRIYEDRLEQLAERERFKAYVEHLHWLLIYNNLIMSPGGLSYTRIIE